MKKIVLFCAGGMSTSLLVTKMQKVAEAKGFDYEISAHPLSEVDTFGPEASIILLGPQVRFKLGEIQKKFTDKPVEAIEMRDYGTMNGENVVKHVAEVLGD